MIGCSVIGNVIGGKKSTLSVYKPQCCSILDCDWSGGVDYVYNSAALTIETATKQITGLYWW